MSGFVFNFRKQFVPAVEAGVKLQTIRGYRKDGRVPQPGDELHLFTGMRTNTCRKLGIRQATSCLRVYMDFETPSERIVVIDGERLGILEADEFARADGFDNAKQMIEWFATTYKETDSFSGFCVRWDNKEAQL